jgi:hypothetical protein
MKSPLTSKIKNKSENREWTGSENLLIKKRLR